MMFILGFILGCLISAVIMRFWLRNTIEGTFEIGELTEENSAVGIKFHEDITNETTKILLKKISRN